MGGGGGGGGGRIGSPMAPAGLSSVPLEPAASGPSVGFGESSAPAVSAGFWSLKYYQPLFDVDTVQVLNRIKGSLLPRPKGAFFELVSANPDLYGPFWVSTTLIFAMAITGNLASFFAFKPTPQHPTWTYNFNQLTLAGSVVYSYVFLLPLLFWLLLRYYEAGKKLVDVVCIYGYTLSVFIPISVLCVLPSDVMRWALVLVGGALSGIFLQLPRPPRRLLPVRRGRRQEEDGSPSASVRDARPPPHPLQILLPLRVRAEEASEGAGARARGGCERCWRDTHVLSFGLPAWDVASHTLHVQHSTNFVQAAGWQPPWSLGAEFTRLP